MTQIWVGVPHLSIGVGCRVSVAPLGNGDCEFSISGSLIRRLRSPINERLPQMLDCFLFDHSRGKVFAVKSRKRGLFSHFQDMFTYMSGIFIQWAQSEK